MAAFVSELMALQEAVSVTASGESGGWQMCGVC